MRLRPLIFNLHLYLGLVAGLLLAVLGMTGTVLVFRPEIDSWLERKLHEVPVAGERASLQALVSAVEAEYPGQKVRYIFPPQGSTGTLRLQLAGTGVDVFVDPYRGTVLGTRGAEETFTRFLYALHSNLLGGETGKTVVGIAGVVLFLLGLSGLFLWWPGYGRLRQGLQIQWRTNWKRTNFDLHRVVGVLVFPLLILTSATGTALVFSGFFTSALHGLAGSTPEAPMIKSALRDEVRPLPLDDVVRQAEEMLRGAAVTRIALANKAQSPVVVRMKFPHEAHPNGMSFVHIDQYSGAALAVQDVRRATAAGRILNWRYPLHIGVVGGTVTRALTAAGGVMLALVTLTGYLMWWNRIRVKRRGKALAKAHRVLSNGDSEEPAILRPPHRLKVVDPLAVTHPCKDW